MSITAQARWIALSVLALAARPASAAPPSGLAPETNLCASVPGPVAVGAAQWNGWGRDLDNTRYQPEPAIRAADVPRLALKWAYGFQGSAVSGQPTVVDGRLYVASAVGRVYALDARTGCTYWTYDAAAGVPGAVTVGEFAPPRNAAAAADGTPTRKSRKGRGKRSSKPALAHRDILKAPSAAIFGDAEGTVYALDAQTGALRWKTRIDAHPLARILGASAVYRDRVYVVTASDEPTAAADPSYACCSSRGSVAALDMVSGRVVWQTYLSGAPPQPTVPANPGGAAFGPAGVPVAAAASIDALRGLLYVATGEALTAGAAALADAVVALDLADGSVRWAKRFANSEPIRTAEAWRAGFDSSPILRTLTGERRMLLAAQRSGTVYALDPDRGGELLWQSRVADGQYGGIAWGPAADHRNLYVALAAPTVDGAATHGGLAALDLRTGVRRWQTPAPQPACAWGAQHCSHAESAAVTVIPGAVFSGAMDGHLRAYSTIDGRILWDFATATDFTTVNGVRASGGSLDRGGATVVSGMLYVNSGYGQRAGQPGNVLLALSVDGK